MQKRDLDTISEEEYKRLSDYGRPEHNGDYFSLRHPSMSPSKRAKIFAPFAALKGFDEEIGKKEIQYTVKPEATEEMLEDLDQKIKLLQEKVRFHPLASVQYFQSTFAQEDSDIILGTVETVSGTVQRIDPVYRIISIDGIVIPFEDILAIALEET